MHLRIVRYFADASGKISSLLAMKDFANDWKTEWLLSNFSVVLYGRTHNFVIPGIPDSILDPDLQSTAVSISC